MDAFLINVSSFPIVIYSTGLVVMIGYWILVLFGLFDIDAFDIGVDIDFEIEGDISQIGGIAGLLTTLGLTGVPITVVISLLILNSWFICYFINELIPQFPQFASILQSMIGTGIAIVSFLISIPITSFVIKPLKRVFRKLNQAPIALSIIGSSGRVRSSRVDNGFGEVECRHQGASLIVKVRTTGEQIFSTGDTVVLIKHNADEDTYIVVGEKEFKTQLD